MKCELKTIEKRIYKLEVKLGIVQENTTEDYWKLLNLMARIDAYEEVIIQKTPREFPEFLKFAREVYKKLLKINKEEFEQQLEEEQQKRKLERKRIKERKKERRVRNSAPVQTSQHCPPEPSVIPSIVEGSQDVPTECDSFTRTYVLDQNYELRQCEGFSPKQSIIQDTTVIPPKKSTLFPNKINWDEYG